MTPPHPAPGPGRRGARWARPLAAAACALALAAAVAPGATAHQADAAPEFGPERLAAASEAVRAADVPGTAWTVDAATGSVLVTADSTVSPEEIDRIERSAGELAGALTFERAPGELRPLLAGGEAIFTAGARCTAGFNSAAGGAEFVITAGHCTSLGGTWYADPSGTTTIGPTAGSSFPGNDYGVIRHANASLPRPGSVICNGEEIDIVGARNPTVGDVLWIASPTGCTSGTVTALNQSVNYGGGDVVSGLARSTACSEPGSSGSPVFTLDGYAVGIVSGGSGSCSSGGTTYVQPILEVLNAYGLTLT
ncbi:S1 family peptidase [Streptomyces radicis]|uniref:S1 family peptidase n=1 Tax=Streptomyces radicis TaxID=1750517 RepID=A0A3A9W8M3_9ACTN|nr:S1 family peptidase [Streptomyces radicis]RKN05714.1 S1 family peptidase [Streptomyces radicis]RKN17554.1 S1 family peptidase [Streptomyces radicis]